MTDPRIQQLANGLLAKYVVPGINPPRWLWRFGGEVKLGKSHKVWITVGVILAAVRELPEEKRKQFNMALTNKLEGWLLPIRAWWTPDVTKLTPDHIVDAALEIYPVEEKK